MRERALRELAKVALGLLLFALPIVPSTPFGFAGAGWIRSSYSAGLLSPRLRPASFCATDRCCHIRHGRGSLLGPISPTPGHFCSSLAAHSEQSRIISKIGAVADAGAGVQNRVSDAAYTSAINACKDDVEAALKILEEMDDASADPAAREHAVVAAIAVCGRGRAPETARRLFDTLAEPNLKAYKAVLQAMALSGRCVQAQELLFECFQSQYRPDTECLNIALDAYLGSAGHSTGRLVEARSAGRGAHHLLKLAMSRLNISPDAKSYATAAEACMLAGDCSLARWLGAQATELFPEHAQDTRHLQVSCRVKLSMKIRANGY
jgi:hypothetical protein